MVAGIVVSIFGYITDVCIRENIVPVNHFVSPKAQPQSGKDFRTLREQTLVLFSSVAVALI